MAGKPALPWGHSNSPSASDDGFEASLRKIILSAALGKLEERPAKRARTSEAASLSVVGDCLGADEAIPVDLSAGQRIEVKWQLDNEGVTTSKWWGATLIERKPAPAEQDSEAAVQSTDIWTVRYDAHEGFDKEDKDAFFITRHVLSHEDTDGPLSWRLEGESYEPQSDDDDDDSSDEEADESERAHSYPVTAIGEAIEQQMGCSVEVAALQRMSASLPIEQQQTLAAGFNEFITHISSKLKEAAKAKADNGDSEGVVILSDDVKAAVASWKREREESA